MICSIFELWIKLTLNYLLSIVANKSWRDTIPSKQQWQGLICFTFECHSKFPGPFKVCGIYLCTSLAPFGQCTGKCHVWEYRMCQVMIIVIMNICSKSSRWWGVEHSPNPSLSCDLNSLLGFLQGYSPLLGQDYRLYWWFSDLAYQCYADLNLDCWCSCKIIIIHDIYSITCQWVWGNCAYNYWSSCYCGRDAGLTLMICHLSLTFWIYICRWIPWRYFWNEINLWIFLILIFWKTWWMHIKIAGNTILLQWDNEWGGCMKRFKNLNCMSNHIEPISQKLGDFTQMYTIQMTHGAL